MGSSSDLAAEHIAFNFSTYNQQIAAFFDRRLPRRRPMFRAMKALIRNFNDA
jgi:hypothetical protein